MAIAVKELVPRKFMEDAQTTQYTADKVTTIIDKATLTNTTTANVVVDVYLVPSGQTPQENNLVLSNRVVFPDETYNCPELIGQIISDGGFISTLTASANAIVISVAGREIQI